MPDVIDLAQAVRKAHPGQYDNVDDATLGKAYKLAHPGSYDNYTDVDTTVEKGGPSLATPLQRESLKEIAVPHSPVSKSLDIAGKILGAQASGVAKNIIEPLVEPFANEPAKTEIKKLASGKAQITASDVLEQIFPFLKSSISSIPEQTPQEQAKTREAGLASGGADILKTPVSEPTIPLKETLANVGRTVARFGLDTATDPLMYEGIGEETKLGKVINTVKSAGETGTSISLNSRLAKQIAEISGEETPSAQIIKNIKKIVPAKGLEQQIATGQRSLVNLGPFKVTGKLASKVAAPIALMQKNVIVKNISDGVRELMSNKTGHPEYDQLVNQMRDLALHRSGLEIQNGQLVRAEIENLTRELNIPRPELETHIRNVIEGSVSSGKMYSNSVRDILDTYHRDKMLDAKIDLIRATKAGDKAAMEEAGKRVIDHNSQLNIIRGSYTPPTSLSPRTEAIVRNIREKQARDLFNAQTSGVRSTPLLADIGYYPHILTDEARDAMFSILKKSGKLPKKLGVKQWNEELENAVRRQFVAINPIVIEGWKSAGIISARDAKTILNKDSQVGLKKLDELLDSEKITDKQFTNAVHTMTADQVNTLSYNGELSKVFGDFRGDIFHTDPAIATTIRGMRNQRAITSAEFFNEVKQRGIALPDDKAPPKWVNVRQKELEGFKVPPEIGKALNRWDAFNTDPDVMVKALRLYDKFHNFTKSWTLFPFAAFHTKKIVGDFWNNFLAGVVNPDVYKKAVEINHNLRGINITDGFGKVRSGQDILQKAKEMGVVGKGMAYNEIHKGVARALSDGSFKLTDLATPTTRNTFLKTGFKLAQVISDDTRLAHFLDRIVKGDTDEMAAASVRKFQFNWGDLSPFERTTLNRVFFFYTWMRNNIPLQLQNLVMQPGKYSLPFKAKHEIEKNVPQPNEKYLPENIKESFPIRTRYNAKTKETEYFVLNHWLPAFDLTKLVNLHDIAANSLAPLPKFAIQQLWNIDIYKRTPIETIPGQKGTLFGARVPSRIESGVKMIRLLNEIDKLSKPNADNFHKLLGIITGQNYTFNPTDAKIANTKRVKMEIDNLRAGLIKEYTRAKNNNQLVDKAEVNRIINMIKEKAKEF